LKKLEDYVIPPLIPSSPVGDPQISPDGSRLLFTRTTLDIKEDKYHTHIWQLKLAEKKSVQFTYGLGSESNPRWSPNGRNILFVTIRGAPPKGNDKEKKGPKPQIYLIPADGGEARPLTQIESGAGSPIWFPNGRKILFISSVFKGEKMEDSDVRIISRIRYRMNGRGFYDGKRSHLFTVSNRGGKVKQITDGNWDVANPTISPDGKTIAFTGNLDEGAELSRYTHIYTVPDKGGAPEKLLHWGGTVGGLSYSPDGKYLAFTGKKIDDPDLDFYRNSELWVMPSEGGEPRCLTGDHDRTMSSRGGIKWAPDSRSIYITVPNQGTSQLCNITLDGTITQLTEGQFSIGALSMDKKAETIILMVSDPATPYELYKLKDGGLEKLTDVNSLVMKKLTVNPPEEFWFKARDGVDVQGWIIKPHGYKEGKMYPTILEVHGGPHGAYGWRFGSAEHEFQTLASYGFVVVYTNPRGSTSYGEAFARGVSGHWGERDYEDIMEAMDYVLENYRYVDPNRLGITGGSYGGYMTNWVVGQTGRFKAAVTQRSISNWHSMMGTSDIGWRDHEVSYGQHPWDNAEKILKHSPISYLGNVTTPLLIIHSELDYRCPIEQGEQMYIGLKRQGKETMFIRFPGEHHGLAGGGKPKHRLERLRHIVRWFDHYLNP
jgi:dipeptidyl aminopeptidase/acylaminoacyl peptidase